MAEWSKAHAWNACRRETVSRVRIPVSPPPAHCEPEARSDGVSLFNGFGKMGMRLGRLTVTPVTDGPTDATGRGGCPLASFAILSKLSSWTPSPGRGGPPVVPEPSSAAIEAGHEFHMRTSGWDRCKHDGTCMLLPVEDSLALRPVPCRDADAPSSCRALTGHRVAASPLRRRLRADNHWPNSVPLQARFLRHFRSPQGLHLRQSHSNFETAR